MVAKKEEKPKKVKKERKKATDYSMTQLWRHYEVTMSFYGRVCGSVPLSKEIVPAWINSRTPKREPGDSDKPLDVIEEEVLETLPGEEEQKLMDLITLGFQRNNINGGKGELVVRGGTIKSHLKDCAYQIRTALGVGAFKSKVANKIYIDEYFVPLMRDGEPIMSEDDEYTQPVHTFSRSGPINALKVIKFVKAPVTLTFTLKMLHDPEGFVTINSIDRAFEYGSTHGYGGERGMGEGRYNWSIKELERPEPRSGIIG